LHPAGQGPIFGPLFAKNRPAVRLAVLSDIHSNWPALEAVAAVLDAESPDAILYGGDVVGYGADPALCLEWVRDRCDAAVLGNHDLAVASGEGIEYLPEHGQLAAEHNAEALTAEQRHWIANLPLTVQSHGVTLAHASPQHPERWLRIESFFLAQEQFKHFDTDVCFVGHTHLPGVLSASLGVLRPRPGHRFLINVGSVGQPRDGDPRACFAFFDTETFELDLRRAPYNVDRARQRIREEGLPESLGRRLDRGQ
jgi:diadenosine tetraphosphatase ApaH/serine/threonine PP2A family protein phosphatase